jgi:hypothetical protein
MIQIVVAIRDLLKRASELKGKSKLAQALKAQLALAHSLIKDLRLDSKSAETRQDATKEETPTENTYHMAEFLHIADPRPKYIIGPTAQSVKDAIADEAFAVKESVKMSVITVNKPMRFLWGRAGRCDVSRYYDNAPETYIYYNGQSVLIIRG